MESILEKGLKTSSLRTNSYDRFSSFYNCRPIYFINTLSKRNDPDALEDFFRFAKFDTIIKVDVTNFEQLPDIVLLSSLNLTYDFDKNEKIFYKVQDFKEIPDYRIIENDYIRNYVISKHNHVPIEDFKTNEQLAETIIELTNTFCVTENISPKFIEDVYEID